MITMTNLSEKNVKIHTFYYCYQRSIIIYLFLQDSHPQHMSRYSTSGYVPMEEHDSAGVVKFIHLKPKNGILIKPCLLSLDRKEDR